MSGKKNNIYMHDEDYFNLIEHMRTQLRLIVDREKMSPLQVAQSAKINRMTLYHMLSSKKHRSISLGMFFQICKALGYEIDITSRKLRKV